MMNDLPVSVVLPEIQAALIRNRPVVLQAPPGSGKTTLVAPSLLDAPWLAGKKILLLEPRRLAARAAARYMAGQLGEEVGERVGFQVRLERVIGRNTRIEVLTEGLLTQRMLQDPELSDTGCIIFDEFHERSLAADMGFALVNDIRAAFRTDLRLIVMSATLDAGPVAAYLGPDTAIITSEARQYPVETVFLGRPSTLPIWESAAQAVGRALEREPGSVLVFLPGEGEIRRTEELLLRPGMVPGDVRIHPLYAALDRRLQDDAVLPPVPGIRKVVLATSIAESSITIQGIRVVIDTGWMRVPRFSVSTGMERLETLRITRDRADQRRGRAGRTGPGVCYRLWDEPTDRGLAATSRPEILDTDLSAAALQISEWSGSGDDAVKWLTPPPQAVWSHSVELLRELGALDSGGRITTRGRRMVKFPVHPRLSNMIIEADECGWGTRACELAATLAGDPALADRWKRQVAPSRECPPEGLLLAFGYPDRIGRKKEGERYQLADGTGARFTLANPQEWIVAGELQDTGKADMTIRHAEPFDEAWIDRYFAHMKRECETSEWDRQRDCVRSVKRKMFGGIVLAETAVRANSTVDGLLEGIRLKGVGLLNWSKSAKQLQERLCFLARALPDCGWEPVTDAYLTEHARDWLISYAEGMIRWSDLDRIDLHEALSAAYVKGRGRELERLAPTHFAVPSGSNCMIRYDGDQPYVAVRIQEVFGLTSTPRIADGRAGLVLHLLSPAQRPVQVTADLESFWNTGYELVRKDLRGRYPKHYWPEDPRQAKATARVRPRSK